MAIGKSEDYEEAVNEAVEKSFSGTAKVIQLNVGGEQTGVIKATVNVFEGDKTIQQVNVSQQGDFWVAKTI
jgi:hypothetical protein